LRWGEVQDVVTNGYEDGGFAREEDACWVELVQPSVASPLVEWLRETVELYREEHARRTVPAEALDEAWSRHPAVAFARTVLGES
jgi:hypothetical protein